MVTVATIITIIILNNVNSNNNNKTKITANQSERPQRIKTAQFPQFKWLAICSPNKGLWAASCNWMSGLDRFKNISSSSSSWVSALRCHDIITWLSAQVHINAVPFTKPMTFSCRWDIHYIRQCQNTQYFHK